MGNQSNKQQAGQIYIRSDKSFYYPGDTVSGTVHLYQNKPYPGTTIFIKIKGTNIHMIILGIEISQFRNNPSSDDDTVWAGSGKNVFYRHSIPLYKFNYKETPPGQYAFPFSFCLANYLPGSFEGKTNQYDCQIKYKIKAELDHQNKKLTQIKYTQPLILREILKQNINMVTEMSVTYIQTWCCLNKGNTVLKCYFDKNAYLQGETAQIICEVDNSYCQIDISKILVKLIQQVELKSDQGEIFKKDTQVAAILLPGVKKGCKAAGEYALRSQLQLKNQINDKPLQASTNGTLVKCNYQLVVLSEMNGFLCCNDDPQLKVPLIIYYAPPIGFQQISQPENWQPQVMPQTNIVIQECYSYPSENSQLMNNIENQQQPKWRNDLESENLKNDKKISNPNKFQLYHDQV